MPIDYDNVDPDSSYGANPPRTRGMNTVADWDAQFAQARKSIIDALEAVTEGVYDLDGLEDANTRFELAGVRKEQEALEWALQGALAAATRVAM